MTTRIIEDIEEALLREFRKVRYNQYVTRNSKRITESFSTKDGSERSSSVSVGVYPGTHVDNEVYPNIDLHLLRVPEDDITGRAVVTMGEQVVVAANNSSNPRSYEIILKGGDIVTTNGGGGSTATITHRKIRNVTSDHTLRLLNGENIGSYKISSIILNGNGPHIINLNSTLLDNLPSFKYISTTGVIIFDSHADLYTVQAGDYFYDANGNSFEILSVNRIAYAITIDSNQSIASSSGGYITRTGDILKNDDQGKPIYYMILDTSSPVTVTNSLGCEEYATNKYTIKNWDTPCFFEYAVYIESKERDDHIAVLNKLLLILNPRKGAIQIVKRNRESYESTISKDFESGANVTKVADAYGFTPGDSVYIITDQKIGEQLIIDKIDYDKNAIKFTTSITEDYKLIDNPIIVANADLVSWNRFVIDHDTDDFLDSQFWRHKIIIRIEGWFDSRMAPYSDDIYEKTSDHSITFIEGENTDESEDLSQEVGIEDLDNGTDYGKIKV